jgi:putative DNA primase/helicase
VDDIGAAKLFFELHSGANRFVAETRPWYAFNGQRWVKDEGGSKISELCKAFEGYHGYFSIGFSDEDYAAATGDKALLRYAAGLPSLKRRDGLIRDARTIEPLSLSIFDRDPYTINLQNGEFDFRTMTMRPHSAVDYFMKITRASFDPTAACPRWERFIDEIMCSDTDTARYLQKAFGYALSGDTSEHCLFVLHGV